MADSDNDPTTATPIGETQPMAPAPDQPAAPTRSSGWRSGQVAVVAVLALLLGGAGATLAWLASDEGEQEPADTAIGTSTSTTSEDPGDRSADDSSTSTTSVSTTTTTRRSGSSNQSGGQTVVGNGVFTGSYQSNNDQSHDVTVDDDWKIRWDVPEGEVTIEIFDAAGELFETIDAQGRGEFTVAEGGAYRVDISTDGSRYSVTVTDGP